MARQLRETIFDRFSRSRGLFKALGVGAFMSRRNLMDGSDVSIDVFFGVWHDCRRAKEDIALLGIVSELNAEAQVQYSDTAFDLAATVASVTSILNAIQLEIGTSILNVSARGVIRTPYARCVDNPPFFNPVSQVDYAQTVILIDSLRDAVTIDV